ncbi:hypothetical protein QR680_014028 [Steinernema hermaphroditum]|uniref:Uncharacterized protein n=1 Tax=Steinernema hermaphroditum TaxID=289476 RepID=A0AA39IA74_9BILA|nr:hypothetical protein QR680_014028 [Steinernema hermaphroditum]
MSQDAEEMSKVTYAAAVKAMANLKVADDVQSHEEGITKTEVPKGGGDILQAAEAASALALFEEIQGNSEDEDVYEDPPENVEVPEKSESHEEDVPPADVKPENVAPVRSVLGIDLGSSFCRVAVVENGEVVEIPCSELKNSDMTKEAFFLNPTYVKNFQSVGDLIVDLKKSAEAYLNHPVKKASLTVPTVFNDHHKDVLRQICIVNGIDEVSFADEATTAAYMLHTDEEVPQKTPVLFFNLGGGFLDIAVMKFDGNEAHCLAKGGLADVGGNRIDMHLANWFHKCFQNKHCHTVGVVPMPSADSLTHQRLLFECEAAKRTLSVAQRARISLEPYIGGVNFEEDIARAYFEEMFQDLCMRYLEAVADVLAKAQVKKEQITYVVLSGESCRIPMIQETLLRFFNNRAHLNKNLLAKNDAVFGAAIEALAHYQPEEASKCLKIQECPKGPHEAAEVEADETPLLWGTAVFDPCHIL